MSSSGVTEGTAETPAALGSAGLEDAPAAQVSALGDSVGSSEVGSAPVSGALVEVQHLWRRYGSLVAVRDLSFCVGRGEIVGFLGPNGAGKSTTLRVLVGYLGPSAGNVRVNGFDIIEEPLRARQAIGYMPEAAPLYPEMRVVEYLRFRARLKRIARAEQAASVALAMERASVTEVARSLIGTLSRGFRQRVALADALLGDPPLLILDEPTAGLDPNQIHGVREVIRELGADHTVLLSTHILSEVESTCSRAIVIDRGTLVAAGTIRELRRSLGSTQALLTVHDPGQQALSLLAASGRVARLTPVSARASLLPLDAAGSGRLESGGQPAAIESFEVTFEPGADAALCLEELVEQLVHARIGVREARLSQSSLEDVFRQLTGAEGT